jgi:hypothetical protein
VDIAFIIAQTGFQARQPGNRPNPIVAGFALNLLEKIDTFRQ